jgi:hypothetical protein
VAADFFYKSGDTLPEIQATLRDADDVAVNLTGATVRFHLRRWCSDDVLIDEEATLVVAASGTVKYALTAEDVELLGVEPLESRLNMMEWEVTFADGSKLSFPSDGHLSMLVKGEIA